MVIFGSWDESYLSDDPEFPYPTSSPYHDSDSSSETDSEKSCLEEPSSSDTNSGRYFYTNILQAGKHFLLLIFFLISRNVGMTNWWKSMGTWVGMEQVQEQPHVRLSTSHHTHINIPTCGVFTISK